MAESVYKVIELIGTSSESWEKAAAAAIERAAMSLETCASPRSSSRTGDREWQGRGLSHQAQVSFKYENNE